MADSTPKSYHTDPTLYLYTSLTSGSSQIVTATSRLETILKANKISFQALDVATDEKARMLWGRRAGKKKLPGLVRMGMIVADLPEVEDWNEYGEVKDNLSFASAPSTTASTTNTPSKPPPTTSAPPNTPQALPTAPTSSPQPSAASPTSPTKPTSPLSLGSTESPLTAQMRQLGIEAAKKAGDAKAKARAPAVEPEKRGKREPEGAEVKNQAEETPAAPGEKEELEGIGEGPDEEAGTKEGEGQVKDGEIEHRHGTLEPKVAATGQKDESGAGGRDIKALEEHGGLEKAVGEGAGTTQEGKVGLDEDRGQSSQESGTEAKHAIAATDKGEDLPGKKIKEQGAAVGEEVGDSVAD